jgi:hypothetical protein
LSPCTRIGHFISQNSPWGDMCCPVNICLACSKLW